MIGRIRSASTWARSRFSRGAGDRPGAKFVGVPSAKPRSLRE
jgi:hypothetical protein